MSKHNNLLADLQHQVCKLKNAGKPMGVKADEVEEAEEVKPPPQCCEWRLRLHAETQPVRSLWSNAPHLLIGCKRSHAANSQVNNTEGGGGRTLTRVLSSDTTNDRPAQPARCLQMHTTSPAAVRVIDYWKGSCGVLPGDETQSAGVFQVYLVRLFIF